MENKKYVLYTICHDGFIEPCTTMLFSFLYNNPWWDGDIIILCDDYICKLNDSSKEAIRQIKQDIKFITVNYNNYSKIFDNFKNIGTSSLNCCWYKFEMFKECSYDKILYLDSDIIVKSNINEILELEHEFICCEDKLSHDNIYFNAGVLCFNGNKDNDKYNALIKFAETATVDDFKNQIGFKGLYNEQCVLNELVGQLYKDVFFIDSSIYNLPHQNANNVNTLSGKILHFCGDCKPWNGIYANKSHEYYHFYSYIKNKSKKVSIFGFNHKITKYQQHDDFINTPLQVGKFRDINRTICNLNDLMMDNIGQYNRFYLELTGIYFIWKNVHSDIKGHEHYRRRWNINENEIIDILQTHDIILPIPWRTGSSVKSHYIEKHSLMDILSLEYIIKKQYPEYADSFNKYIINDDKLYYANAFIAKQETYDKMCSFIFSVLNVFNSTWGFRSEEDIKKHIMLFSQHECPPDHIREGMTWEQYQLEVQAFLFERLITLYVRHNFQNIYEANLIQMEPCGI